MILPALNKKIELWSTNKKVIGAHVDPSSVENAHFAYTIAFDIGPRDCCVRNFTPKFPPQLDLGGLTLGFAPNFKLHML